MTLLQKVVSHLAKPASELPVEAGAIQQQNQPDASRPPAPAQQQATRPLPRSSPPPLPPALSRSDLPSSTCLKFAPLPKPSLEPANRRVCDPAVDDGQINHKHDKLPSTTAKDNKHRSLNVDVHARPVVSPEGRDDGCEDLGGDTEEIWFGEGSISADNDTTCLSLTDEEDHPSSGGGKKAFRCLASRPRSPLVSSSSTMAFSFSQSASLAGILSTPPLPPQSSSMTQLSQTPVPVRQASSSSPTSSSLSTSTLSSEAGDRVVDGRVFRPSHGHDHPNDDLDNDQAEEDEEDEEDEEEEDEKHEAALARSRSTSRAAGVEKFHKHHRPDATSKIVIAT